MWEYETILECGSIDYCAIEHSCQICGLRLELEPDRIVYPGTSKLEAKRCDLN